MQQQVVNNILELLKRVPLKGDEVPAFVECTNFLYNLLKPKESIDKIEE